jgi:3-hydroxy acid dehydrogenase / malonic semialdehyde reductase
VRDNQSVSKFVSSIPKEFEEIDILLNNAGLALGLKQAADMDLVRLFSANSFI